MGHPRKQKAARKRCEACGHKAIYSDIISAQMDGMYSNQAVVRCPQNKGYHLTTTPSIQEASS